MCTSPERPGDDVGGFDTSLRKALGYAPDFLDRPTDEIGRFVVAARFVFFGAGLSA
jgi:hypothetical protein